jgi:hypothetical protein
VRRARRVQVQFWKQGDPHSYPGYTTNISTTGMFLATRSPFPQGTRLRIEVLERDRGFMVEGVVAHARKVRGELMRVTLPGMGIRFLSVDELVREMFPAVQWGEEDIPAGPPDPVRDDVPNLPDLPEPAPAPDPSRAAPPPPPASPPAPPPAPPAAAPPAAQNAPRDPGSGAGAYTVGFASPAEFLEVFQRDILQGGLFVPTRYPGRLHESLLIDLVPPLPFAEPVRVHARVVQRFEPRSADLDGANLLSGMGLELLDLPRILEQLRPAVERIRSQVQAQG